MKEKALDLVYLDSGRYPSLKSMKSFFWGILLLQIFMIGIGFVALKKYGMTAKGLFPFITFGAWIVGYWTFIFIIQSKRVKKTFPLRFLVSGIEGLFFSFIFYSFIASFNSVADTPFFDGAFALRTPIIYLLVSAFYVAGAVILAHRGYYRKIKEKSRTAKALKMSAFFGALIPISGTIGMSVRRAFFSHAGAGTISVMMALFVAIVIYVPALSNINFLNYYYCKKYNITCDEDGETTSPLLEPQKKEKRVKKHSTPKKK